MDQPIGIIVAAVRFLQFIGNMILSFAEILARFTPATHLAIGSRSPMTYRHELNAVKLHEVDFFVSLLEDIRNHFLISESTRLVYSTIAEQFFLAMDPALRGSLKRPTQRDFYDYVFYKWPTFSSYRAPYTLGGVHWGWVGKGDHEVNEINIASDIVFSAATWDNRRHLPLDLYKMNIVITILHEMSHAFTKYYFNQIYTPFGVGVGPSMSKHGESGWLAEERLFDGRFFVYWDDATKDGDLAAISGLILSSGSESWVIDENVAKKLLSSFRSPRLDFPPRSTLTKYLPSRDSVQARVTETSKPMSTTERASTPIGLGLDFGMGAVSFIGDDRKYIE